MNLAINCRSQGAPSLRKASLATCILLVTTNILNLGRNWLEG